VFAMEPQFENFPPGGGKKSALIVGAGLVGPVIGVLLARQGFAVELFDRNGDPRPLPAKRGKSVNLTLATRGFGALDAVGIGRQVRELSVPVYGRVIHGVDGTVEYQPYGSRGECLYSISRHRLSQVMVDLVEEAGIPIHFGHRCTGANPSLGEVRFETAGGSLTRRSDLVIGADGARSELRHRLVRHGRVQYSQRYADHANKELHLPATEALRAGLEPHALHMWPRRELMLIAFPNLDGSFTCTLHMPYEGEWSFESVRQPADVEALFARHFSDVRPLLTTLLDDYASHPEIPMVTVRCAPLTFGQRLVLIGDAAHAVWPSYGQGANAGFEDCALLADCLDGNDIGTALETFDGLRRPDASAIADLSEQHFEEIRDRVGDPGFQARKRMERRLNELYPDRYVPQYVRVAFTNLPYSEAVRLEARQHLVVDRILETCGTDARLDTPEVERLVDHLMEELT
jgi:kynurenine 3-monooxygenase